MILDNLSNSDLQELIGDEILTKLEQLLPALSAENNFEPIDINKKDILKRIVMSFGDSCFKNKNKRLNILNRLSEGEINKCIQIINPNLLEENFDKKIKFIANNWDKEKYSEQIINWAGLPVEKFISHNIEKEDSVIEMDIPKNPFKTLKEYQIPIFLRAKDSLKINNRRFIIQMPTGSGKTRTSMEIITDYINSQEKDVVVVWLAHSDELCGQALECFIEIWQHVARKKLTVYRCWGNNPIPKNVNGNAFIVAGFPKMNAALNKDSKAFDGFANSVGLIIVDEAHKVLARTYKKVTNALTNIKHATRLIGLTATPGRHLLNIQENKKLSDYFFNEIFSIESGTKNVIAYLREKKVLSNLIVDTIKCSSSIELTAQEKRYLDKEFDFPPGFLRRLGTDQIRNIEILKKLDNVGKKGHQILFFGCSIEHSKFICAVLNYLGYKAVHIDGATNKKERQLFLKQFKNKEIQIVCNYGVLSTGFDAPKTDVVCISRPTSSVVLYSQMIGRGLRGPAIGGTEECILINIIDNIKNLPNYQDAFDVFDEYWKESE